MPFKALSSYFYLILLIVLPHVASDLICNLDQVFSADKTKCLQVASAYGENCTESVQCSQFLKAGGICEASHCTCKIGYHYLHGQCIKSSELHNTCEYSNQCYIDFDPTAAVCNTTGKCQCAPNYDQLEYRSCRRRPQTAASCLIDNDCNVVNNTTCDQQSKVCISTQNSPAIIASGVEKIKLMNVSKWDYWVLGETCDYYDWCNMLIPSSECSVMKKCICKRAHFPAKDNKHCIPELGESCISTDPDSEITDAICSDYAWRCKSTKVASRNNRQCLKVTHQYNKSCSLNEQCYLFGPDAACINKKCVCNEKSHFLETAKYCWRNRILGEECSVNNDCFMPSNRNLQCKNRICVCPEGSHVDSKGKTCVKNVTALGDRCVETNDCKPLLQSSCITKACLCPENYYPMDNKCIAGIKAPCDDSKGCQPINSTCQSNVCTCNEGYVAQWPSLCVPVSIYGQQCRYDIQCSAVMEHAICNFTISSSKTDDRKLGNGTCLCSAGYHYNYGKCHEKRLLGQNCINRGQCYIKSNLESIVCRKGMCSCNINTVQLNDTFCNGGSREVLLSSWIILSVIGIKYFI